MTDAHTTRDPRVTIMANGMEAHSYPGGVSGRMAITIRQMAAAAFQALDAAGFVVVPRDATTAMINAVAKSPRPADRWSAMVAAYEPTDPEQPEPEASAPDGSSSPDYLFMGYGRGEGGR